MHSGHKKKMYACGKMKNDENNNKEACTWSVRVGGWHTHIYIYYIGSCVSIMTVVFGKYESGRINYV